MSLDYIITSPVVIDGTTLSNLSLEFGGDSINLSTPSSLLNTYDIVLPPNLGLQNQVLTLNSSLETIWADIITGTVDSFSVSSDIPFFASSAVVTIIPNTTITPPTGTYYCNFSSSGSNTTLAIFVDGNIINSSTRRATGSDESISIVTVVTVNGSQSIDIRATSSSVTIFERTFIIIKIG